VSAAPGVRRKTIASPSRKSSSIPKDALIEPEGLIEVPNSEVDVGEAFRPDRHNPILIRIGRAAARKALAGSSHLTLAKPKSTRPGPHGLPRAVTWNAIGRWRRA
jgi:hypothetical protein